MCRPAETGKSPDVATRDGTALAILQRARGPSGRPITGGSHVHRLRGAARAQSLFTRYLRSRRKHVMDACTAGATRRHRLAVTVLASVVAVSGIGWIASSPVASASDNAVIDWNAVAGQNARAAPPPPAAHPPAQAPP